MTRNPQPLPRSGRPDKALTVVHPHAAGIDIGATEPMSLSLPTPTRNLSAASAPALPT
jgi:hypothetical protein